QHLQTRLGLVTRSVCPRIAQSIALPHERFQSKFRGQLLLLIPCAEPFNHIVSDLGLAVDLCTGLNGPSYKLSARKVIKERQDEFKMRNVCVSTRIVCMNQFRYDGRDLGHCSACLLR